MSSGHWEWKYKSRFSRTSSSKVDRFASSWDQTDRRSILHMSSNTFHQWKCWVACHSGRMAVRLLVYLNDGRYRKEIWHVIFKLKNAYCQYFPDSRTWNPFALAGVSYGICGSLQLNIVDSDADISLIVNIARVCSVDTANICLRH